VRRYGLFHDLLREWFGVIFRGYVWGTFSGKALAMAMHVHPQFFIGLCMVFHGPSGGLDFCHKTRLIQSCFLPKTILVNSGFCSQPFLLGSGFFPNPSCSCQYSSFACWRALMVSMIYCKAGISSPSDPCTLCVVFLITSGCLAISVSEIIFYRAPRWMPSVLAS